MESDVRVKEQREAMLEKINCVKSYIQIPNIIQSTLPNFCFLKPSNGEMAVKYNINLPMIMPSGRMTTLLNNLSSQVDIFQLNLKIAIDIF